MEGEGVSLVGQKTWLGHSLVGLGPCPLKHRMWFLLKIFEFEINYYEKHVNLSLSRGL